MKITCNFGINVILVLILSGISNNFAFADTQCDIIEVRACLQDLVDTALSSISQNVAIVCSDTTTNITRDRECVTSFLDRCPAQFGREKSALIGQYVQTLEDVFTTNCDQDFLFSQPELCNLDTDVQCLQEYTKVILAGSLSTVCSQVGLTLSCLKPSVDRCTDRPRYFIASIVNNLQLTFDTICVETGCNLDIATECIQDANQIYDYPVTIVSQSSLVCNKLRTSLACAYNHTYTCVPDTIPDRIVNNFAQMDQFTQIYCGVRPNNFMLVDIPEDLQSTVVLATLSTNQWSSVESICSVFNETIVKAANEGRILTQYTRDLLTWQNAMKLNLDKFGGICFMQQMMDCDWADRLAEDQPVCDVEAAERCIDLVLLSKLVVETKVQRSTWETVCWSMMNMADCVRYHTGACDQNTDSSGIMSLTMQVDNLVGYECSQIGMPDRPDICDGPVNVCDVHGAIKNCADVSNNTDICSIGEEIVECFQEYTATCNSIQASTAQFYLDWMLQDCNLNTSLFVDDTLSGIATCNIQYGNNVYSGLLSTNNFGSVVCSALSIYGACLTQQNPPALATYYLSQYGADLNQIQFTICNITNNNLPNPPAIEDENCAAEDFIGQISLAVQMSSTYPLMSIQEQDEFCSMIANRDDPSIETCSLTRQAVISAGREFLDFLYGTYCSITRSDLVKQCDITSIQMCLQNFGGFTLFANHYSDVCGQLEETYNCIYTHAKGCSELEDDISAEISIMQSLVGNITCPEMSWCSDMDNSSDVWMSQICTPSIKTCDILNWYNCLVENGVVLETGSCIDPAAANACINEKLSGCDPAQYLVALAEINFNQQQFFFFGSLCQFSPSADPSFDLTFIQPIHNAIRACFEIGNFLSPFDLSKSQVCSVMNQFQLCVSNLDMTAIPSVWLGVFMNNRLMWDKEIYLHCTLSSNDDFIVDPDFERANIFSSSCDPNQGSSCLLTMLDMVVSKQPFVPLDVRTTQFCERLQGNKTCIIDQTGGCSLPGPEQSLLITAEWVMEASDNIGTCSDAWMTPRVCDPDGAVRCMSELAQFMARIDDMDQDSKLIACSKLQPTSICVNKHTSGCDFNTRSQIEMTFYEVFTITRQICTAAPVSSEDSCINEGEMITCDVDEALMCFIPVQSLMLQGGSFEQVCGSIPEMKTCIHRHTTGCDAQVMAGIEDRLHILSHRLNDQCPYIYCDQCKARQCLENLYQVLQYQDVNLCLAVTETRQCIYNYAGYCDSTVSESLLQEMNLLVGEDGQICDTTIESCLQNLFNSAFQIINYDPQMFNTNMTCVQTDIVFTQMCQQASAAYFCVDYHIINYAPQMFNTNMTGVQTDMVFTQMCQQASAAYFSFQIINYDPQMFNTNMTGIQTDMVFTQMCQQASAAYFCVDYHLAAQRGSNTSMMGMRNLTFLEEQRLILLNMTLQRVGDIISDTCVGPTLECYSCTNATSNEECNMQQTQSCPLDRQVCGTMIVNNTINKGCVTPMSCQSGCMGEACSFCCEGDLCNQPWNSVIIEPETCKPQNALWCGFQLLYSLVQNDTINCRVLQESLTCMTESTRTCLSHESASLGVFAQHLLSGDVVSTCIDNNDACSCGQCSSLILLSVITSPYKDVDKFCMTIWRMYNDTVQELDMDTCDFMTLQSTAYNLDVAAYLANGICNVERGDGNCTYGDKTYPNGASFTAMDGCNTCMCSEGNIGCALMYCPPTNDYCNYYDKRYENGETFQAPDGCNTCTCSYGFIGCTEMYCPPDGNITSQCDIFEVYNCISEADLFNKVSHLTTMEAPDLCSDAARMLSCIEPEVTTCGYEALYIVQAAIMENLQAIQMYCDIYQLVTNYNNWDDDDHTSNETDPDQPDPENPEPHGECSIEKAQQCFDKAGEDHTCGKGFKQNIGKYIITGMTKIIQGTRQILRDRTQKIPNLMVNVLLRKHNSVLIKLGKMIVVGATKPGLVQERIKTEHGRRYHHLDDEDHTGNQTDPERPDPENPEPHGECSIEKAQQCFDKAGEDESCGFYQSLIDCVYNFTSTCLSINAVPVIYQLQTVLHMYSYSCNLDVPSQPMDPLYPIAQCTMQFASSLSHDLSENYLPFDNLDSTCGHLEEYGKCLYSTHLPPLAQFYVWRIEHSLFMLAMLCNEYNNMPTNPCAAVSCVRPDCDNSYVPDGQCCPVCPDLSSPFQCHNCSLMIDSEACDEMIPEFCDPYQVCGTFMQMDSNTGVTMVQKGCADLDWCNTWMGCNQETMTCVSCCYGDLCNRDMPSPEETTNRQPAITTRPPDTCNLGGVSDYIVMQILKLMHHDIMPLRERHYACNNVSDDLASMLDDLERACPDNIVEHVTSTVEWLNEWTDSVCVDGEADMKCMEAIECMENYGNFPDKNTTCRTLGQIQSCLKDKFQYCREQERADINQTVQLLSNMEHVICVPNKLGDRPAPECVNVTEEYRMNHTGVCNVTRVEECVMSLQKASNNPFVTPEEFCRLARNGMQCVQDNTYNCSEEVTMELGPHLSQVVSYVSGHCPEVWCPEHGQCRLGTVRQCLRQFEMKVGQTLMGEEMDRSVCMEFTKTHDCIMNATYECHPSDLQMIVYNFTQLAMQVAPSCIYQPPNITECGQTFLQSVDYLVYYDDMFLSNLAYTYSNYKSMVSLIEAMDTLLRDMFPNLVPDNNNNDDDDHHGGDNAHDNNNGHHGNGNNGTFNNNNPYIRKRRSDHQNGTRPDNGFWNDTSSTNGTGGSSTNSTGGSRNNGTNTSNTNDGNMNNNNTNSGNTNADSANNDAGSTTGMTLSDRPAVLGLNLPFAVSGANNVNLGDVLKELELKLEDLGNLFDASVIMEYNMYKSGLCQEAEQAYMCLAEGTREVFFTGNQEYIVNMSLSLLAGVAKEECQSMQMCYACIGLDSNEECNRQVPTACSPLQMCRTRSVEGNITKGCSSMLTCEEECRQSDQPCYCCQGYMCNKPQRPKEGRCEIKTAVRCTQDLLRASLYENDQDKRYDGMYQAATCMQESTKGCHSDTYHQFYTKGEMILSLLSSAQCAQNYGSLFCGNTNAVTLAAILGNPFRIPGSMDMACSLFEDTIYTFFAQEQDGLQCDNPAEVLRAFKTIYNEIKPYCGSNMVTDFCSLLTETANRNETMLEMIMDRVMDRIKKRMNNEDTIIGRLMDRISQNSNDTGSDVTRPGSDVIERFCVDFKESSDKICDVLSAVTVCFSPVLYVENPVCDESNPEYPGVLECVQNYTTACSDAELTPALLTHSIVCGTPMPLEKNISNGDIIDCLQVVGNLTKALIEEDNVYGSICTQLDEPMICLEVVQVAPTDYILMRPMFIVLEQFKNDVCSLGRQCVQKCTDSVQMASTDYILMCPMFIVLEQFKKDVCSLAKLDPHSLQCPQLESDTVGICQQECNRDLDCVSLHLHYHITRKQNFTCCTPQFQVDKTKLDPRSLQCPQLESDTVGICLQECNNDLDCGNGNKKCCSNGCGNVCTELEVKDRYDYAIVCDEPSNVTCTGLVCQASVCEAYPTATCIEDDCSACEPRFYYRGVEVTENCDDVINTTTCDYHYLSKEIMITFGLLANLDSLSWTEQAAMCSGYTFLDYLIAQASSCPAAYQEPITQLMSWLKQKFSVRCQGSILGDACILPSCNTDLAEELIGDLGYYLTVASFDDAVFCQKMQNTLQGVECSVSQCVNESLSEAEMSVQYMKSIVHDRCPELTRALYCDSHDGADNNGRPDNSTSGNSTDSRSSRPKRHAGEDHDDMESPEERNCLVPMCSYGDAEDCLKDCGSTEETEQCLAYTTEGCNPVQKYTIYNILKYNMMLQEVPRACWENISLEADTSYASGVLQCISDLKEEMEMSLTGNSTVSPCGIFPPLLDCLNSELSKPEVPAVLANNLKHLITVVTPSITLICDQAADERRTLPTITEESARCHINTATKCLGTHTLLMLLNPALPQKVKMETCKNIDMMRDCVHESIQGCSVERKETAMTFYDVTQAMGILSGVCSPKPFTCEPAETLECISKLGSIVRSHGVTAHQGHVCSAIEYTETCFTQTTSYCDDSTLKLLHKTLEPIACQAYSICPMAANKPDMPVVEPGRTCIALHDKREEDKCQTGKALQCFYKFYKATEDSDDQNTEVACSAYAETISCFEDNVSGCTDDFTTLMVWSVFNSWKADANTKCPNSGELFCNLDQVAPRCDPDGVEACYETLRDSMVEENEREMCLARRDLDRCLDSKLSTCPYLVKMYNKLGQMANPSDLDLSTLDAANCDGINQCLYSYTSLFEEVLLSRKEAANYEIDFDICQSPEFREDIYPCQVRGRDLECIYGNLGDFPEDVAMVINMTLNNLDVTFSEVCSSFLGVQPTSLTEGAIQCYKNGLEYYFPLLLTFVDAERETNISSFSSFEFCSSYPEWEEAFKSFQNSSSCTSNNATIDFNQEFLSAMMELEMTYCTLPCNTTNADLCLTTFEQTIANLTGDDVCNAYDAVKNCLRLAVSSCESDVADEYLSQAEITFTNTGVRCYILPPIVVTFPTSLSDESQIFEIMEGGAPLEFQVAVTSAFGDICFGDTCELEFYVEIDGVPITSCSSGSVITQFLSNTCVLYFDDRSLGQQTLTFELRIDHRILDAYNATFNFVARLWDNRIAVKTETVESATVMVMEQATGGTCRYVSEPMVTTFDGLSYYNFYPGLLTMYQHETLQETVQVFVQTCSLFGFVLCPCSVSVLSGDDVFVIDTCRRFGEVFHPIELRVYQNGDLTPNTKVYSSSSRQSYQFVLPSGTIVSARLAGYLLDVTVQPSSVAWEQASGLCGTYNGITEDDFTLPNGNVEDPDSYQKWLNLPYPFSFVAAWRPTSSLLLGVPADNSLDYLNNTRCDCTGRPCIETDLVETCDLVFNDEITLSLEPYLQTPPTSPGIGRKRRQIGSSDEIDVGTQSFSPPNITWPTASGYTEEFAIQHCNEAMNASQSWSICSTVVDTQSTLQVCVANIWLTDSTNSTSELIDNMERECQIAVVTDPSILTNLNTTLDKLFPYTITCPSNCSNNGACLNGSNRIRSACINVIHHENVERKCQIAVVTDPSILTNLNTTLDKLFPYTITCPSNCSNNGACLNGTCVCNFGFMGEDCSILSDTPPVATYLSENVYSVGDGTGSNATVETQLYVYGENFINSANLMCHMEKVEECQNTNAIVQTEHYVYKENFINSANLKCHVENIQFNENGGYTRSGNTSESRATSLTFGRVMCSVTGTLPLTGLLVSVSNNGVNKSAEFLYIIQDEVCYSCNATDGTCSVQIVSCLIDGKCYGPGIFDPANSCYLCDPISNGWRYKISENCSATTTTSTTVSTTTSTTLTPPTTTTGAPTTTVTPPTTTSKPITTAVPSTTQTPVVTTTQRASTTTTTIPEATTTTQQPTTTTNEGGVTDGVSGDQDDDDDDDNTTIIIVIVASVVGSLILLTVIIMAIKLRKTGSRSRNLSQSKSHIEDSSSSADSEEQLRGRPNPSYDDVEDARRASPRRDYPGRSGPFNPQGLSGESAYRRTGEAQPIDVALFEQQGIPRPQIYVAASTSQPYPDYDYDVIKRGADITRQVRRGDPLYDNAERKAKADQETELDLKEKIAPRSGYNMEDSALRPSYEDENSSTRL